MIGILQGVGAVLGISGTLAFPHLRRKLGLEYTGTIGGVLQLSALSLGLLSIFAPGHAWDPQYFSRKLPYCQEDRLSSASLPLHAESIRTLAIASYESSQISAFADFNTTDIPEDCIQLEKSDSYLSISLLMAGIVGARFGGSACLHPCLM
jgi:iron-regulated transporter 1